MGCCRPAWATINHDVGESAVVVGVDLLEHVVCQDSARGSNGASLSDREVRCGSKATYPLSCACLLSPASDIEPVWPVAEKGH